MKVLVVGGAGYIGSHCVKQLVEQDHDVVVYDNLQLGNREAVPDQATLERGDVLDRPRLAEVFKAYAFDGVMHFAALLDVHESISHPQRYYENNVLGSLNLLGEMIAHDVKRIVFSSSCAVYGIPPAAPITEDMPTEPITPYGRTKLIVEMALADLARTEGLSSVALRYFNAAGAAPDGTIGEARAREYHLIPLVLQVALGQRESISIFGNDYPTADGTAVRDYVHVDDLASAHLLALEGANSGTALALNIGTGCGTSVRQIIEAARQVTNVDIPVLEAPRREGDPPELYADPSLIVRHLAWEPKYTRIEDIIETAWNWHRHHPNGFDV